MRNPIVVLKNLREKSQEKSYQFERLYRNLYNPEFYLLAYKNIYANEGSMTKGTDGLDMDGMGMDRINKLINSLKDYSYKPNPARRTYIEKKNSTKKRPLGIPSTDDKLLQEVVRLILESIYEPTFSDYSHGFRPNRSCHTALKQIKDTYKGVKWFVEGDIKACFDSFDHHVLVSILRKKIKDEHFINLIWKLLKAGYMEQWKYNQTYSGTPQGSGASPILANIYLSELDNFIEQYASAFETGEKHAHNPDYTRLGKRLGKVRSKYNKIWSLLDEEQKEAAYNEINLLREQLYKTPSKAPIDNNYKRMRYCRYADDWLVGVIGSKAEAEKIKADVKEFLKKQLKLELSEGKTLVTHSSELVRFLGYDITISRDQAVKRNFQGVLKRPYSYSIKLYVPKEKWVSKLHEYKALRISKDEQGNEVWKPIHRGELINRKPIDIIAKYNSEIRGLYNYYCLANNATVLQKFSYIMEYSLYKTFAAKFDISVQAAIRKFSVNGNFGVQYNTKKGVKRSIFYNEGFRKKEKPIRFDMDLLPRYVKYDHYKSVVGRLKAGICEMCENKIPNIEMHQVKKLKDLAGNKYWEQVMISKRRKTLALCPECHVKLHEGLLD